MKYTGLIGCGAWGKNILRDLLVLGCTVYVADTDPAARLRALHMGAVEVFENLDLLPSCDGYVVAVPIPDLIKVCAGLLQYRKPIFSEKTLCLSPEDFDLLNGLGGAELIFVMHKWHYHPGIEALRLVAESGKIGKVEQLCTTRHAWVNDFHGGDVFWTQSVHDLTIIKHIIGFIPNQIRIVNVIRNEAGLPVSFTAFLGGEPAVVMSVSGNHCNRASGVSIHGSRGTAALTDAYDDHIVVRHSAGEEKIMIDTTFPLYLELNEFIAYLHGGPPPRCTLDEAGEVAVSITNLRRAAGLNV
jgi:predicted dehydrogenase